MKTHMQTSKSGSILVSVCRGKVSEGYDFNDDLARVVMIIGLPYPNIGDTKIIMRQEYFIEKSKSFEWLKDQAVRAVNQALGRVIRHKNDFGAIYLVDKRYSDNLSYSEKISKWVRDSIQGING